MNEKDTNPKDRLGVQRPPLSTVSGPVLFEIGAAMLEGAAKYGRHNYRVVGVRSSVYFDATMRHLWAWWEGQDIDPDSGMSHVSKAIASLVVLRDAQIHGKVDNDDRPPPTDERWLADIRERVKTILETYPDGPAPYTAARTEESLDTEAPDQVR